MMWAVESRLAFIDVMFSSYFNLKAVPPSRHSSNTRPASFEAVSMSSPHPTTAAASALTVEQIFESGHERADKVGSVLVVHLTDVVSSPLVR